MAGSSADTWLSSKEVLARTGISRATLNNYIALGILSKPRVAKASGAESKAPRIGYFPPSTVDRIARVAELKGKGMAMAEIVQLLRDEPDAPETAAPASEEAPDRRRGAPAPMATLASPPRLTLDQMDCPAYLVNGNFEVEWCNPAAAQLLGLGRELPGDIRQRDVFRMLMDSSTDEAAGIDDLLSFHLSIAKRRLSREAIAADAQLPGSQRQRLERLYDAVEPASSRGVQTREVDLGRAGGEPSWHAVYASFFREGILFVFHPAQEDSTSLLEWLARRDIVIRDILRRRRPCLTPLAVLVADLQDSVKICSELPPEEYFQLINEIWSAMEPLLRRFYATHGKHVGDGMVYYFFPQPDASYVMNALRCAHAMRTVIAEISDRWRSRKRWLNELRLNIGIDEGEEWFGTYQAATHVEFTVLGDTVNRAARLSDMARGGAVWATKNVLSRLSPAERQRVRFGVRRQWEGGESVVIPETFARVCNLLDLSVGRNQKLQDIAVLPVTEIMDVAEEGGR